MQYFLGWRVIINRKILILHASMKKMMMGVAIALMMAVAFVACSSDDEERLEFNNINGAWTQVHDPDLADAGIVRYTFLVHDVTGMSGSVSIYTSDAFAGDTTIYRDYTISEDGWLHIYGGDDHPELTYMDCQIRRLNSQEMVWAIQSFCGTCSSDDILLHFKKEPYQPFCGNN